VIEAWTRGVVRHRVLVLTCWAIVAVLGALGALGLPGLLSTSLAVPGTSSAAADAILSGHFGEHVEGTYTVVVRVPNATTSVQDEVRRRLGAALASVPTARVVAVQGAAGLVLATVGTTLDLQQAAARTDDLRAAIRRAGIRGALVTGPPAIQHDVTPVLAEDLRIGELLAVVLALLLLVFALGRTWVVLVPLVVAAATVLGALGVVYVLAHYVLMVLYVPNVVELIGLGLAIDYSLLMVHRFREESLDASRQRVDAVVDTTRTAGRTVAISALAVALGLSALLLIPVPFVRSLGIAGLVVPIVSLLAALTLQPAVLSLLPRGRSLLGRRADPSTALGARTWRHVADVVLARPGTVLAAALVVLAACTVSLGWLQLTPGSVSSVPATLESSRALVLVSSRIGPGAVTPIQIVIDAGAPGRARSPAFSAATLRLADAILNDPGVFAVAIGPSAPYVDATGQFRRVYVISSGEFGAEGTQALVRRLPHYVAAARLPGGALVAIGGAPAQGVDFLDRVYGVFPSVVALVLALAFLILLVSLRSILLAALGVVLDLVTLAATYGLLVVCFRFGIGADLLGLYRAPQLEGWVPVVLFALLFGLSMDYQVFLVMRMRESWREHGDAHAAIRDGLVHTGRVITTAAVIFVVALLGLIGGRVAGLQELGLGLAIGVLLDATVVRGLLLPSAMALAGPRAWWFPGADRSVP